MKEVTREIHHQAKLKTDGPIEYCHEIYNLVYREFIPINSFAPLLRLWLQTSGKDMGLIAGAQTIKTFYDKKFA